jgi:hypothetical protein
MPSSAHFREADRIFEELENTPDLSRGETRLAAEVALTIVMDIFVPPRELSAFRLAKAKAVTILNHLAKG